MKLYLFFTMEDHILIKNPYKKKNENPSCRRYAWYGMIDYMINDLLFRNTQNSTVLFIATYICTKIVRYKTTDKKGSIGYRRMVPSAD